MKRSRSVAAAMLGTTLLAVFACATVPLTGRRQLSFLSDSEMAAAAEQQYETLLNQSQLCRDPVKGALLERVAQRMLAATRDFASENNLSGRVDRLNWSYALIQDDNVVNASCLPNGRIVVYTGILGITQDESGLAVVIGHEIAHALANHGSERVSQFVLFQLGGMALQRALQQKPEQTQAALMAAYGLGAQVGILLPYSRRQEYEADRIGLTLMARAGYDPHEAVNFWNRMIELDASNPPEFLSTHPASASRVAEIERLLPEAMASYRQ